VVAVETGHKPFEVIVHKALNSAPQRLPQMLPRLQRYNLEIRYKKGKEMFLEVTLVDYVTTPQLEYFGASKETGKRNDVHN